jgi:hypothetical protein
VNIDHDSEGIRERENRIVFDFLDIQHHACHGGPELSDADLTQEAVFNREALAHQRGAESSTAQVEN